MRDRGWAGVARSGLGVATAMTLAAFLLATPASAACSSVIGDPAPGYLGSFTMTSCGYQDGPFAWTAPSYVSQVKFTARGADDAGGGKRGGSIEVTLPVAPGQAFMLEAGGEGNASTISLDATPVLIAGGGNGSVANYVAPGATVVESQSPGAPLAGEARDGEVSVSSNTIMKDPTEREQDEHDERRPSGCIVPWLYGMRPVVARQLLADEGCEIGKVRRRAARRRAWGRVTRQWPSAGTELPAGGQVELRVGRRRG